MNKEKQEQLEALLQKYCDYADANGIDRKQIVYSISNLDDSFGVGIIIDYEVHCFNEKNELVKQERENYEEEDEEENKLVDFIDDQNGKKIDLNLAFSLKHIIKE